MNKITLLALALTVSSAAFAGSAPKDTVLSNLTLRHNRVADPMTSTFKGIEVNAGTVTYTEIDGKRILKLSDDFVMPKTPAPTWQVVDSEGNVYLLKQLRIKGDKTNTQVTLPKYIKNVSKVQIWCAFAEVNLGEAKFTEAVGAMMAGGNR